MQFFKMKYLYRIILVAIFWFISHQLLTVIDGLSDNPITSDYIIILGNKVNHDGTLSRRLQARVDKGYELYMQSMSKKIIVSGGLGKEGFYEGSKMAEYLVIRGIPRKDILIDNKGSNTRLTAINFAALYPVESSIIIVSQFHHISRLRLAFSNTGITKISTAHADYFEIRDLYSMVREFFAYYVYLVFP